MRAGYIAAKIKKYGFNPPHAGLERGKKTADRLPWPE
jgi:hypothetical protein